MLLLRCCEPRWRQATHLKQHSEPASFQCYLQQFGAWKSWICCFYLMLFALFYQYDWGLSDYPSTTLYNLYLGSCWCLMGVVQLDFCAFLQGKNIFSASLCQLHAIWGGCSAEACVLCLLALLSHCFCCVMLDFVFLGIMFYFWPEFPSLFAAKWRLNLWFELSHFDALCTN